MPIRGRRPCRSPTSRSRSPPKWRPRTWICARSSCGCAIARDNLASQEETLQIAQWRAQAGLTTSLDVEQARTSTELTRAQIPALDASIAQARSSLAILTGVTPEAMQASLRVPAAVPTADDDLAFAFPAETLRQRPDVRQAEYQVSAAASRVTQADAARYPSFRLSGTLGVSARDARPI